jgi:hypothetical protein
MAVRMFPGRIPYLFMLLLTLLFLLSACATAAPPGPAIQIPQPTSAQPTGIQPTPTPTSVPPEHSSQWQG